MSIAGKIRVNAHYTRSINLERDADSTQVVEAYIPTSRALKTLERIQETFKVDETPRAWSLVGPYGSGKSSFAIFLSHLLGNPSQATTIAAMKVLRKAQPALARRYSSLAKGGVGHCCILLTGSPEPLARRLMKCTAEAAEAFWSRRPGRTSGVVAELKKLADQKNLNTSEVIKAIGNLQTAVASSGGNGVLIVIDELGKFLEYEARHYGANDIFLLQALAEHAFSNHPARLSIVALLHQSFDQYAKGLGEALKNEWAKVQGRYENVPFLETTEQVLRIVAAAFDQELSATEQRKIGQFAQNAAGQLARIQALPSALDQKGAADLFRRCYPLHPISSLLLPLLCQKVAQNERTLFSYLGSHEQHGFRESLSRCEKLGDWIYPWEIYEYFILNQPAALGDHITHRRWAEVVTAVERLGDAPDAEVQLLKTIGLLNIVGIQGGFKAAREVIELCLPTKKAAKDAAAALVGKSVLQYRKFSGEYRVWQGSDFDLDAAVDEELGKLGRFALADQLNNRHALLPIVARKYTIQTGGLRYFNPLFVDANSYKAEPTQGEEPRIIFFLVEGQDDHKLFQKEVLNRFSMLDVVVEYPNGPQLREGLAEVLALEEVLRSSQELNSDPVAQREFKDRYHAAMQAEQELLTAVTECPESSDWFWQGRKLAVHNKRSLQQELSEVLQSVYNASPIVPNELINRDRPSSQAIAARNKLLMALMHNLDKEDLGIEKYPAEKGIYKALFKASGLHRREKGKWMLTAPDPKNDLFNFAPVWARIEQFFAESEARPLPLTMLNDELMAPPFGIKAGVLPVLYIATYMVHQNELALYEDGVYTPYFTEDQLERFARRPESFTVQRFRIEGMRASIFREYAKALYGDETGEKSLLSIARPLVKFLSDLPEYTQHTKRISQDAQKVRDALVVAKTPEKLLFQALPEACGLPVIDPSREEEDILKGFAQKLTEILRELKYAYPNMLEQQRKLMCQAFNLPADYDLEKLRAALGGLEPLKNFTVDVDGLRALIMHITKTGGSADDWFSALLMFLGKRKPPKKWADTDVDGVEFRLSEYARRINDLEKLRVHYGGESLKQGADFDVILLRTVRQSSGELDEVVRIDDKVRDAIRTTKTELRERLNVLSDDKLQLALLAELTEEFLSQRQAVSNQKRVTDLRRSKRRKRRT